MPQIVSVKVRHFRIPLAEVLVDAKHGSHSHFELITATIQLNDGSEGTGYTYTGGVGGHAIAAMIENDLTPFLIGKNAEDVEGLYDAMQWHVHYVARGGIASKGGIGQLTKAFANEWASKGVNVNAIAPGYIDTDNTEALRNDPDRSKSILERIPANRWGRPEDFAGAAIYLASSASDYVHGTILTVDGGWMGR